MPLKTLGNSDFSISPIGLGTWAIGGDGAFGWGPQDDARSIEAIHRAVERGINWIDTAPIYGFGHAEIVVARALKELGSSQRPLIFSKCSLVWDETKTPAHTLKASAIREDVNESLKRLGVDTLDLCQIHWPSFPPGAPAPDIEEGWTELAVMKEQGKIRCIGVSNFDASQMDRVCAIAPIVSLQPPYSMLMREIEESTLPYCKEHDIGVLGYSPMHNGLLSGKMTRERVAALPETDWRKNVNPAFREPYLSQSLDLVEMLREIGDAHGRSPGEVAIAWTLRNPVVTGAIVGARDGAQVDGFIGAMEFRLTTDEISRIESALPDSINMMQLS
jgi:aryl-alcohol dehydrogenase-like predicted oxidoreductase